MVVLKSIEFLISPHMKMEQSVPKRRHTKFRRRVITQNKEYNINRFVSLAKISVAFQICHLCLSDGRPILKSLIVFLWDMCFVSYITAEVKVLECHTHKLFKPFHTHSYIQRGNIYFLSFIIRLPFLLLYHILTSFLRNSDLAMPSVYCC